MKLKINKSKKTSTRTTTQKPKTKRKVNNRNMVALVISFLVTCEIIVGCFGLFFLFSMMTDKPAFDINLYSSKESSQIFDQNGELIADVGRQIRSNITYDEVPTSLIDAFVAIEDSRFFKHNGFDMARFGKAMLENLKSLSFSQGGSTLTMQISKMTYFMDDESGIGAVKSVARKVQEIALALELESNTNKKSIIEMYLNKSNFGGSGNIRGVQKAANYYFNKDVGELTLPESAMLAGVVNAPGLYNPFRNLDYSTNRRNTVLNMMLRHGFITKEEADLAKSVKVEDLLTDPNTRKATDNGEALSEYAYQSYIDTVIREVQELTGKDPTSTPMKIYTYMDKNIQSTMDQIQADSYEGIEYPDELMELGMVTVDNQTGQIVAIGGGRNYGRGGSLLLNHATDQYKQPGSAVKPFLDYALAFEYLGWSTSHVVLDRPIAYAGTNKVIKNFNGQYYGQVELKDAIGKSWNTPAIQALQEVLVVTGRDKVVEYLQNLGFSKVTKDKFDVGYAIGGSSFECSVVELAAAQAAMINGGLYIKPHTVQRVEFTDGSEPLEPVYTGTQVISSEAAYLTTEMMYGVVNTNYGNYMQLLARDYPVYGKTGTTDWGSEGLQFGIPKGAAKDKWMLSSTSKYTTNLWLGYEKGVKDKDTYFTSKKSNLNLPGKISNAIMKVANDPIKPEAVARPEGIQSITHILATWPYAAPIEGMDGNFIRNGLIKKEFNKTVAPETQNVEALNSFTAAGSTDGTLSITWGAYPNPEQLQMAPDTMDLTLNANGNIVSAWGKRIFDYTWIFGPIRYRARISEGGNVIKEVSSETEHWSENLGLGPGNHTLQVCGYYAYDWLGTPSNEQCTDASINIAQDTSNEEGCKATGQFWNKANNSCVAACPADTIVDGQTCRAKTEQEKCTTVWYNNACHVDWKTACEANNEELNGTTGCKAKDPVVPPSEPPVSPAP